MWRLISDPNSLLARVLLGKHCQGKNLLESKAMSGTLFLGLEGVLRARGMNLLRGSITLAWRLGNKETITTFGHQRDS